jgi:hypothetical protein
VRRLAYYNLCDEVRLYRQYPNTNLKFSGINTSVPATCDHLGESSDRTLRQTLGYSPMAGWNICQTGYHHIIAPANSLITCSIFSVRRCLRLSQTLGLFLKVGPRSGLEGPTKSNLLLSSKPWGGTNNIPHAALFATPERNIYFLFTLNMPKKTDHMTQNLVPNQLGACRNYTHSHPHSFEPEARKRKPLR